MSAVHQVWRKPSYKAQWKGEGDKADRKRGGKTTSGSGQAWSSPSLREQWRTEKNGGNWLWGHLWCPNDQRGGGIGEGKWTLKKRTHGAFGFLAEGVLISATVAPPLGRRSSNECCSPYQHKDYLSLCRSLSLSYPLSSPPFWNVADTTVTRRHVVNLICSAWLGFIEIQGMISSFDLWVSV